MIDKYRQESENLRRQGLSYTEISKRVPVSKGTLSHWLRGIPLDPSMFIRLENLKREGRLVGSKRSAEVLKRKKQQKNEELQKSATAAFDELINQPHFLEGLLLYWSQGYKNYPYVWFRAGDTDIAKLFLAWLNVFLPAYRSGLKVAVIAREGTQMAQNDQFWPNFLGVSHETWGGLKMRRLKSEAQSKDFLNIVVDIKVMSVDATIVLKTWQRLAIRYYVGTLPW
jgi:transcriptional regulator with XRE-family HTH domain